MNHIKCKVHLIPLILSILALVFSTGDMIYATHGELVNADTQTDLKSSMVHDSNEANSTLELVDPKETANTLVISDEKSDQDEMIRRAEELIAYKGKQMSTEMNQLEDAGIELAIYAPQAVRKFILQEGFKNQFEVHLSRGGYDPDTRLLVESGLLRIPIAEYTSIPNNIRPKYGMILPSHLFHDKKKPPHSSYGEDIYLLKLERLQERLTWTPSDSCRMNWNEGFIPWNIRRPRSSNSSSLNYIEFQVWGPLSPEYIKTFIFTQNPPDSDTLKLLTKHKIDTFNGTPTLCPYTAVADPVF